jgi:hypothetical protein
MTRYCLSMAGGPFGLIIALLPDLFNIQGIDFYDELIF